MTTFLIDLWQDLREKRLWPVAVGLLAATAAIPFVLFKPVDEAPPAPAPSTGTASRETLPVVSVDAGPKSGSNLGTFDEKNPFKPMKDLAREETPGGSDSGSGSAAGGSSGSAADGGSAPSGSASKPSSGGSSPSSGGGSTPSSGSPSSGSPSGGGGVEWFKYTADFEFGVPGSEEKYENADSFAMLPDADTPLVVFMGVKTDGKHAVFFVADEGLEADGEGKCNKGGSCRFVELSLSDARDEMTFASRDGQLTFNLKLLDIQRVELDSKSKTSEPAAKRGKGLAATGEGIAGAVAGASDIAVGREQR